MACRPCLQAYAPALPLGIAVDLEGHTPGQGNQVPVVDLWEDLAATAGCMDCPLRTVDLSSFPLGPWDQAAGYGKNTGKYMKTPTKQHRNDVQTYTKQPSLLKHITDFSKFRCKVCSTRRLLTILQQSLTIEGTRFCFCFFLTLFPTVITPCCFFTSF